MNLWHKLTPWNNVPFLQLPESAIDHLVIHAVKREILEGEEFLICQVCYKLEVNHAYSDSAALFRHFRWAVGNALGNQGRIMERLHMLYLEKLGLGPTLPYLPLNTFLTPAERRQLRLAWLDNLLLPPAKRKTYWRRSK